MSTGENGISPRTLLTAANLLTCLRFVLTIPFLYLVLRGRYDIALAIFLVAGLTDFADGYVARRYNQGSGLGRLLDPLADKFLTTSAFVVMAVPHSGFPSIPTWLAGVVVARDVVIVLGALGVYMLTRFRDFSPTMSGKITTLAELALITAFLLFHTAGRFTFLLPFGYAIVVVCVVISGTEYLARGLQVLVGHRRT
ncbi:MAG TPA: CDP-alcohol phosphatidyltransferase family protein [Blastocatellia bacterium]|nr:CDP-alcohol phosphatidyltransferase family protein [Blastocatellia bacterium]